MSEPGASRLFAGSCAAIVTLACSFASLSGMMFQLKSVFLLDKAEVGLIAGAGGGYAAKVMRAKLTKDVLE